MTAAALGKSEGEEMASEIGQGCFAWKMTTRKRGKIAKSANIGREGREWEGRDKGLIRQGTAGPSPFSHMTWLI